MNERLYRSLLLVALVLTLAWVAWTAIDTYILARAPGDTAFLTGETHFEDGQYERALARYEEALGENPSHRAALRGRARALAQLGRLEEAREAFRKALAVEPGLGATWANLGIVLDRMGRPEEALAAYERALELDPKLADGPHWLTRFLRNQPERPPSIADRARYLREELAKPPGERLLRVPELDARQRSYKR